MRVCYKCGAELSARSRVPFKELCPRCDAFLHCCRNCRLYDPNAHNHCRSSTTEYVADPERGNFCDEFDFLETPKPEDDRSRDRKAGSSRRRRQNNGGARSRSAREKFEELFKD
jgi:hypothetical protein